MTFRFNRTTLGTLLLPLLLAAGVAYAQSPDASSSASTIKAAAPAATTTVLAPAGSSASKVPAWTRVHRVDDFVTSEDKRAGTVLADKDAPIVVFSHAAHAQMGVTCEQCHHTGVKGWEAPACATCHKGAAAVNIMHEACISCHKNRGTGPVACNDCHTARQTSFSGIVRFQLYDIARGPLFIAAWVLFALGFAWRFFTFTRLTRIAGGAAAASTPRVAAEDVRFLTQGRSRISGVIFRLRRRVRGTVFGTNPVMGVVSLVFHLALFLVPLLLPAHNILFFQTFRVSLPTLPEPLLDKLTLGLLAIGLFFLLRRIFFPRVRALTTVRDYLILLLVAAPFVTAYMAYHQWLDYRTVLVTHMIIGEICIAAIPFTKLGHMPFLIFSRFFISTEYAWKPGNRRW